MQRPQRLEAGAVLINREAERLSRFRVESKLPKNPKSKAPIGSKPCPRLAISASPRRGRLCGYQQKKAARRRPASSRWRATLMRRGAAIARLLQARLGEHQTFHADKSAIIPPEQPTFGLIAQEPHRP